MGSRNLFVNDLGEYLPENTTEIVSGGARGIDSCARGIDSCARNYALCNQLKITEFLPNYQKYGRSAPIKRNLQIISYADIVIAFWDGKSKGTKFVIETCKKINKPLKIMLWLI